MVAPLATGLWQGLRHLFMPGVCLACHAILPPERNDFCSECERLFGDDPHPTCPRCSSTVGPFADLTEGCPHCRGERFAFDRALRLAPYEGGLRELILRMKWPGGDGLAEAVGQAWAAHMADRVRAMKPELVVAVPLHWLRRWQRGFNQSEALARAWGRQLRLPVAASCLRRVRSTPMQSSLPASARRGNVHRAFRAARSDRLRGRTVLLVDDVMTTGSTAHDAARALKEGGAGSVVLAILAHGH